MLFALIANDKPDGKRMEVRPDHLAYLDTLGDKLVLAGRYLGGEQVVRDAVARLAATRGAQPDWHVADGVRVATWHNQDDTPRVIALLGPAHFAIARVRWCRLAASCTHPSREFAECNQSPSPTSRRSTTS